MLTLNKNLKLSLFLGILTTALITGTSHAHNKSKRGGAMSGPKTPGIQVLRQLDLSEEQREQVKELFSTQRELAPSKLESRNEIRELSEAGNINQAADMAAELARERVVTQANNRQNLEAILTAEQLEKLNSIKERVGERVQRRMSRGSNGPA